MSLAAVLGDCKHFVCVEYLRDSPEGGEQSKGILHAAGILSEAVRDSLLVVIARKDKHIILIVVVLVVGNAVVNLHKTLVPIDLAVVGQRLTESGLKREVHDCREIGVESVPVRIACLPIGYLRHIVGPYFSHDVEVRVLLKNGGAPLGHRVFLVVRVGIHAESVQIGPLDPPHCPLLEILQQVRVVQVHVRH